MFTESRLLHPLKQWGNLVLLKDCSRYYCCETVFPYRLGFGDSPKTAYYAMWHNGRDWDRFMRESK